jgi:hypothetical protein
MCAELADLGMQLARRAAAIALAGWAEPEEPPTAESPPEPEPAAEPPTPPAPTARPLRAAGLSVRALSCKSSDPALIFTRLAATVRDCIALQVRLTAGASTASRGATLALRADPRRAPLRDIFDRITEHHPDRADLVRETTARIDADLTADPDRTIDLSSLFFGICEDLGIEPDLAILPDEFLGFTYEPPARNEAATNAPDPRATSPP